MTQYTVLPVVGWQEVVRFPNWERIKMKAKIDTGAKSSAIHAEEYSIKRLQGTKEHPLNEMMEMKLKVGTKLKPKFVRVKARVVDYRNVKNSGGKIEERPFVETEIEIGGIQHKIILSVTNRDKMKFPVLLGRSFLAGNFLIDCEAKNLLSEKTSSHSKKTAHSEEE